MGDEWMKGCKYVNDIKGILFLGVGGKQRASSVHFSKMKTMHGGMKNR